MLSFQHYTPKQIGQNCWCKCQRAAMHLHYSNYVFYDYFFSYKTVSWALISVQKTAKCLWQRNLRETSWNKVRIEFRHVKTGTNYLDQTTLPQWVFPPVKAHIKSDLLAPLHKVRRQEPKNKLWFHKNGLKRNRHLPLTRHTHISLMRLINFHFRVFKYDHLQFTFFWNVSLILVAPAVCCCH